MSQSLVYLDYNATAPARPEVIRAISEAMAIGGNPSSVHASGRRARGMIEEARSKVAALVGARARDIVFMSGGTEANNAALRMTGAKSLIIGATEHEATLAAAKASGLPYQLAPVTADGVIDLGALESLLKDAGEGVLVSIMLANNETGVIQPVADIAKLVKDYGARVHTDAVQAAGKIDVDFNALGIDYMSLSAHKIGGPQGVGALVLSPTAPLSPLVTGGGQELGRRSGTENVAGIVGFGEAAVLALGSLADMSAIQSLRNSMEQKILSACPHVIVASDKVERLGNTSCLMVPGVRGETQVMNMDLNGICISSGSACSSGKVKVSHVLSAMGIEEAVAECSVRVSLGYGTTDADIDRFIKAFVPMAQRATGAQRAAKR